MKKIKRSLSDTSSKSENEDINRFPRFIVLGSQDDSRLANLSPFVISVDLKPKTVKNLKNGNLVVVERKNKRIFC